MKKFDSQIVSAVWRELPRSMMVVLLALVAGADAFSQDAAPIPAAGSGTQATGASIPRLIAFGGVIKDGTGKPVTVPVYVTFELFAQQAGGMALWSETQTVQPDAQGQYSVLLGATEPAGLPLNLFTTGAARWLAIRPGVPGVGDLSRVPVVGVPYALKAADADTLGGKPASAFLTNDSQQSVPSTNATPQAGTATALAVNPATVPSGNGTTDYIPIWTNSTTLGNSTIFETGGNVGIGNTTPASRLDVTGGAIVRGDFQLPSLGTATASTGYDSQPLDFFASTYNSYGKFAVAQHFRWEAEPVSNDTSAPTGKIDLLYAPGTSAPAETGFSINSKGLLTFAPGQSFPNTGPGTIKGVTAGTDLTGGGTSGVVKLNVDTTKVPQLNTANSFVGNQSVTGNIAASGTISAGGSSAYTTAVYGFNAAGGSGVYGVVSGSGALEVDTGYYPGAVWGDTNVNGGIGVLGTSLTGPAGAFYGYDSSSDDFALIASNTNGGSVFAAAGSPSFLTSPSICIIDNNADLSCTGSKSAVVPVDGGSRRVALYAVEAPENWFEDFGSAQLSNGAAVIPLESVFAQTVNTNVEYHVFLTPKGECEGLYATNETAHSFEVHEPHHGNSNVAFDYRIVARRKGYETIRLADKTKLLESVNRRRRNAGGTRQPVAPNPPKVAALQR